eukprot:GHVQ01029231.1.p2 GENE.GHVQ01029231.1~~GHVQ01029231.1.p2  ORF type:complete len:124 (-),score=15.85 GHVQ01029231.1:443-814(-)
MEDEIIKAMCVVLDGKILWIPQPPVATPKPEMTLKKDLPSTYRKAAPTILQEIEKSVIPPQYRINAVILQTGVVYTGHVFHLMPLRCSCNGWHHRNRNGYFGAAAPVFVYSELDRWILLRVLS